MREMARRRLAYVLVCLLALIAGGRCAAAYSLLTHEQLIDLTWDDSIVPFLVSRYPGLTAAQLEHARAFAYGGCVIQDIGYYPFGDASFSNLTHYVRTGDFIVNLFRNANNADELAFAIGALSHYIGDAIGHSQATNVAVPIEFHKLRKEFGPVVNYAQGKQQHVRTEFAFDINEVAHHRMAPLRYLRHIGLEVSMRQLGRAFYQTYGLQENFAGTRGRRVNVSEYRFAVRSFIPRIAYALTLLHRKREPADVDTQEGVELRQEIAAVAAENGWDAYRRRAGIGTWSLAGLIWILPKVGPLRLAAIRGPEMKTEADYVHSVVLSVAELRYVLTRFTPPSARRATAFHPAEWNEDSVLPTREDGASATRAVGEARTRRHTLQNRDLDTGNVVKPGGYPLTDSTYAALLHSLTRQPNQPIPPGIKDDIEQYYANPDAPITTKKDPQQWAVVIADLATLKGMPKSAQPAPFQTYDEDASGGAQ